MHHKASLANKTLNRIFHAVALAALVIGLAPAAADAAPRKGTVAKKCPRRQARRAHLFGQQARLRGSPRHRAGPPVLRPAGRPAFGAGPARPEVQRGPGDRPGHARSAVLQERLGGAADRLADQAHDRPDRQRSQAADGRDDHHHPGRRGHRKGQQLAPEGRRHADSRRVAAPGAHVQREPRGARARPDLPRRPERLRVGDERQGQACWE